MELFLGYVLDCGVREDTCVIDEHIVRFQPPLEAGATQERTL